MPYLIIIGSVLLLSALIIGISYVTYRIAFNRGKNKFCDPYCDLETRTMAPYKEKTRALIDTLLSATSEDITVTSHDGLKLWAKYYHAKENAPVMIQMHGYKSTPARDFSGGYKIVTDLGLNLIQCQQRAHENSEGKTITFGILEKEDCLRWIKYASHRFGKDTKIILCGISMGAATVLMAAGEELPSNVVGVIADCPYSSAKDIILKVAREDMHLPGRLFYPFLYLGSLLFGKFKLTADSPVEAVRRAKIPILLFHGQKDRFVPHSMSQRIKDAAQEVIDFHSFPDADHGMCYVVDRERYSKITSDFIKSLL